MAIPVNLIGRQNLTVGLGAAKLVQGPKGDKGDKGDTGNGISSAVLNNDYTLTLTFTDGSQYTTPSIRGATGATGAKGDKGETGDEGPKGDKGDKGDTGNGISGAALGDDYTLTLSFTDGTQYTTPSIRGATGATGPTGEEGPAGNGIASVTLVSGTHAAGTTDTYRITFTNGTWADFTVYNGADGEGSGDMLKSIYDPTGKNTDVFGYVDEAIESIPTPDVSGQISAHNSAADAHSSLFAGKADASELTSHTSNTTVHITAAERSAWNAKQAALTFDSVPTADSGNPVTSGGIKTALDAKQGTLTFDSAPTADSGNPVTSGGIKTALDAKQGTLTFDSAPTADSGNPVTSGGIKTALDAKADTGHTHSADDISGGTLDSARLPTVPVSKGGTGAETLTSGAALIGNGTGAVTTRSITNNTSTTSSITGSTNLVTMNTLRYAMNRTTGIGSADTGYSTAMVRAIKASTTDLTAGSSSLTSGQIYLVYE